MRVTCCVWCIICVTVWIVSANIPHVSSMWRAWRHRTRHLHVLKNIQNTEKIYFLMSLFIFCEEVVFIINVAELAHIFTRRVMWNCIISGIVHSTTKGNIEMTIPLHSIVSSFCDGFDITHLLKLLRLVALRLENVYVVHLCFNPLICSRLQAVYNNK